MLKMIWWCHFIWAIRYLYNFALIYNFNKKICDFQLYRTALDTRGKTWGPVEFHRFDADNHFGHKYICRSIELPHIVTKYFDTYKKTDF